MIVLMVLISRWYMRRYKAAAELWDKEIHWIQKQRIVLRSLGLFRKKTALL